MVSTGTYQERIILKPNITVRSEGDSTKGTVGIKRAEKTIIDGGGNAVKTPGVVMAEGSTLDGFTIINVGQYDDALWQKHFTSKGEELGDDEGSVQAEGTTQAISIHGVSCTITNCIVHHNGDVGIGVLGKEGATTAPIITKNIVFRNMGGGIGIAEGAEPVIRENICYENLRAGIGCRKATPLIINNICYNNIRAGIGCREGSTPVIKGNKCYQNQRAGIGIRMAGTAPIVEGNECYENQMAGIGCRDNASPIIRNNTCRKNKLAGIGCQNLATPLIVSNVCTENEMAGIGLRSNVVAIIQRNKCLENKLVAIGVTSGSTATIAQNELTRTGGMPPLVMITEDSIASLQDNQFTGGGIAAILVQGNATISCNKFLSTDKKQGQAIWVRPKSTALIRKNEFDGYRSAVNAAGANVVITENTVTNFKEIAISVKDSLATCHVYGNHATSASPNAKVVDIQGPSGINENNVLEQN